MNRTEVRSLPVSGVEDAIWFEQKIKECEKNLFRFAFHLTGNKEKAEDLVQETFLRAFQYRHSYDHTRSFENWVYAILFNVYRQRSRKERIIRFIIPWRSQDDEEERFEDCLEWEGDDPEKFTLKKQVLRDLYAIIEKLPTPMKEVMVLCDFMDYSYEEASEIARCPIGTVRSRLHRARKLVRARLEEVYGEEILSLWS